MRPATVVLLALSVIACGGRTTDPIEGSSSGSSSGSATSSGSSGSSGVVISPTNTAPFPVPVDAGPPPRDVDVPVLVACKADQDCNENASTSSLLHECFEGVCICATDFHVQPSGKCARKNPSDCPAMGGKCRNGDSGCLAGEIRGASWSDFACGDFVPASCCMATCKSPVDLVCCGESGTEEPRCVSGWRTCEEGRKPSLRSKGCR